MSCRLERGHVPEPLTKEIPKRRTDCGFLQIVPKHLDLQASEHRRASVTDRRFNSPYRSAGTMNFCQRDLFACFDGNRGASLSSRICVSALSLFAKRIFRTRPSCFDTLGRRIQRLRANKCLYMAEVAQQRRRARRVSMTWVSSSTKVNGQNRNTRLHVSPTELGCRVLLIRRE